MTDAYQLWEALGSIGMPLEEIQQHVRLGINPLPRVLAPEVAARNADIAASYKAGMTLEQIGSEYGITRERIRQILKKQGITRRDGGASVTASINAEVRANTAYTKRHEAIIPLYGCTRAVAEELNEGLPVTHHGCLAKAYRNQQRSAYNRGIPWNFTFPQWVEAWKESGKLAERGLGKDKYCMARKGDVGAYEIGNVEFITHSENSRDALLRDDRKPLHSRKIRDEYGLTKRQREAFDLFRGGMTEPSEIAKTMNVCYGVGWLYWQTAKKLHDSLRP